MHEAIILANWPSCLNSLAWSHDCTLALAAGETVELLMPVLRLDSDDIDTGLGGTQQWINVHIRTNLFTPSEVLPVDPLPSRANSIGEEISTSEVAAVDWSPPGLAKHSRCALAVLATNLSLSIWASDSDPKITRSWRRVLILNHELERYCQSLYGEEEIRADLDWETRRRLRRRVRSFAWSPQLRPEQSPKQSIQDACFPVNGSFIAVANDYNDVVILRVDSPFSFFSPAASKWSARAVAHFSLEPKLDLHSNPRPFTLDETLRDQRYISNLAWSPWATDKNGVPEALLAYTTNDSIHLRRIRSLPYSSEMFSELVDVFSDTSVSSRNAHLLRWMPRACDNVYYLMAFSQAGAFCYEVPVKDPARTTVSSHDLDKRWDMVIGCAFNGFAKENAEVQFTSQIIAPIAKTSELKMPIEPIEEPQTPLFQQSIRESEQLFSAENELAGHTLTKAWAMCSSPLGDLVASGVSFHPGDMVEYTIAATSRTHIGIQPFRDTSGAFTLPASGGLCPVEDLSAETLIYCAKTWLEDLPEESRAEHAVRNTILDQYWNALGLSKNSIRTSEIDRYPRVADYGLSLRERTLIVQALRRAVFSDDKDTLKQRYGRLLTLFFDPKGTTQSDDAPAIQKLVTEVLKLPKSCYNDSEVGRKIRTVYASMLPWLTDAKVDTTGDEAMEASADIHVEGCEICDDSIGFESFAWARCGQGHEFVRCSLTFLAIQAPGISKLCGICGKRYLNEEYLRKTDRMIVESGETPSPGERGQQDVVMQGADSGEEAILTSTETDGTGEGNAKQGGEVAEGAEADGGRLPITLTRILFGACDVCIYCGGKFVG
ncbi:transcription factor IIIC subunit delta N-term-domain-containing protein [Macrophomina phaseolina]|uniref:Transcription factor IIIC subunit delta N-term-domain-containing protein n=1 Tax=Macrophomina phaseolina TaxID=35725 RepID=A0ABQ8GK42_9PEZI|nr:transcription factor IIIC subunit delta N-term-domain-containing protein [Macrophomina phaseolina]